MPKRLEGGGTSENGSVYVIEIHDSLWSGSVTDFQTGPELFVMDYQGQEEDEGRFVPILSSSLTVNMLVQDSNKTELEQFIQDLALNANEERFTAKVTKDSNNFWFGVLLIDRAIKQLTHYPYTFQVRFSDGLARLKKIDYNDNGTSFTGKQTFIEHLFNCLNKTGTAQLYQSTDQFLKTYVDWYAEEMPYVTGNDPLQKSRMDNKNFINVDTNGFINYDSSWVVLQAIVIAWGCRLIFSDGAYYIVQPASMSKATKVFKQYTKSQTQTLSSFVAQNPKRVLASDGTENPYDLKLTDRTGFIEWFPPLRRVYVDYKHYSQRNIINGQDIIDTAWSFPDLDSNGANARLIFTGSIEIRMNKDAGSPLIPYFRKYGLKVSIGTRFLKRSATLNDGIVEFQRSMTWELTTSYYEFFSPVLFTTTDPVYIDVEFITPGIPVDGDLLVELVVLGSVDLEGNSLDTANYSADESLLNAYLEILTTGKFEDQANVTRYEALNNTSGNSEEFTVETLIGQGPSANAFSHIEVQDSINAWVVPTGFRKADTGTYYNFSQLLANEILSGQISPKERLTGHLVGDFSPHELLIDGSITRIFNGGRFIAYRDQWEGEWYELGESGDYAVSDPIDYRKLNDLGPVVDPPIPIISQGGGGTGGGIIDRRTPFEEVFNDAVGDRVTVTVNGGILPYLKADLVVQLNGNDQTRGAGEDYIVDGSDIIFNNPDGDGTPLKGDKVKVKFVF